LAIYSLNVATVGKTTHMPGTAGAHLRYIGRHEAVRHVEAEHMPDEPQQARTWMDRHEAQARKNARVMTKIRIALPRELDERQRTELLRDTVREMTGGRVPWFAAIHDRGKDAHNPHAHVAVIDRDIETGKRVLRLSDGARERRKAGMAENGVEAIRQHWEYKANAALERAGHAARIDRRSLEVRGEDRTPQIHIGPQANHIDHSVHRPESRVVPDPTPQNPERVIDYPAIDAGRTRREYSAGIVDLNLERAARSQHFETRVWAQLERDQRQKDKPVERAIAEAARRRTVEERALRRDYAARLAEIRNRQRADARLRNQWLKQRHTREREAMSSRQHAEKADLRRQQSRPMVRFLAALDVTGRTRGKREAARKALAHKHMRERRELTARLCQERADETEAVKARYRPERERLIRDRDEAMLGLRERHAVERDTEDFQLQERAREREQARQVVQQQIADWKRIQKYADTDHSTRSAAGSDTSRLARDWRQQHRTGEDDRAEAARRRMDEAESTRKNRPSRRRRRGPQ